MSSEGKRGFCSIYEGNNDAKGYSWLGAARGMISMANLFLNQSFLFLAYQQAGCELGEECFTRVYGFYPSSWITNVPVIAGITCGFVMPVFGAIVDFTDYRRALGILTAALVTITQAIQVYTVAETWFIMCLLQSLAVVFYFTQLCVLYAYLPDIARQVGEFTMAKFTSYFQIIQFGSQAGFLVVIAIVSVVMNPSTVMVGQISQGLNAFSCIILFSVGWFKYLEPVNAVRKLPEGHNMITEGFKNNFKTLKEVNKHYKKGIRWFFLGLCFSQAAAQAIVTVSVIYLTDTLTLSSLETSIFFLAVLVCSLAGCPFGAKISQRFNPNTSYKVSMFFIFCVLTVGALTLETAPKWCVFIWGGFVGTGIGWFFATEPLFFSMILPVGQEAEMSGFYNFCSNVLAWLPPLIFTVATENRVEQKYAIIMTASFFLVAIAILSCAGSWDEILEEAKNGVVEGAILHPTDGKDVEQAADEGGEDEKA